jgi:glyoxylase-like metal-dependent hydrolase (beta-lactamase superfamily II)
MKIVEGVYWIKGANANCFMVVDDELTLIDTGFPRNAKKIIEFIKQDLHRDPSELKTIVLTHSHYDHVGCASELRERTGARVAAHPEDAGFIEGTKRPVPPKGAARILVALISPFMKPKRVKVDIRLNDGDAVAGMKVVHVPGHTPGSIALLDPMRRVLFSGDALMFRNAIGREDRLARI